MMWRNTTQVSDKIYGSLAYLLPMSAAVIFGIDIFNQFPPLRYVFLPFFLLFQLLATPILPVIGIRGDFVIFLCLFFFVIRNSRINSFIRFNVMQALLMEIILFISQIVIEVVAGGLQGVGSVAFLGTTIANTIFLAATAAFGYCIYHTVQGQSPEIPAISDAAAMQTGGF